MGCRAMKGIIERAYSVGAGLPAFNFESVEMLEGLARGAADARSPIIVQTTSPAIDHLGLNSIVNAVNDCSRKYGAILLLHLDHSDDVALAKCCVDAGYDSVMVDFSKCPVEENIKKTKDIIRYAESKGVLVESEIGVVGDAQDGGEATDPNLVEGFIEAAPVDLLAVSVGSVHGGERKENRLDIDLLKTISSIAQTPLVLHGSSGVVNDDIRAAISNGVVKINIETEMRVLFKRTIEEHLDENPGILKPRMMFETVRSKVAEAVVEKCRLFQTDLLLG